jgi:hypothetical protein
VQGNAVSPLSAQEREIYHYASLDHTIKLDLVGSNLRLGHRGNRNAVLDD